MSQPSSKHNMSALSQELVAMGQRYYVPNYKPREMILDKGQGARVWDLEGKDYIDLGSGIAVCSLGHRDPDLIEALVEQADKLWHTSNIFFTEPPIRLAKALVESAAFADRVYLCNSGAEANEAMIKLVRKYAAGKGRDPEHREIITFTGSFHGRTLATVTATAQPKYQEGYEPLPGGFTYCPRFNDEEAISALVSDKTCAIVVEPIQGEGGVMPAKPGFLKHLRELCDKHDALLVFDEIQCGMGRTGTLYAHQHEGVEPDIMTLAKALGGGIPIGAMLVGKKAAEVFQFGSHGSTFGGNPIMAAVALKALEKISNPDLLAGVEAKHALVIAELAMINEEFKCFSDIRGRGLMIGAELTPDYHGKAGDISEAARKAGVLVLIAGPNVIRFLPPLVISENDLHLGLVRFRNGLESFLRPEVQQEEKPKAEHKPLLIRAKEMLFGKPE